VDDLIVKPIDIRASYAYPSDRPGLGVELDEDALRKYRACPSAIISGHRTFSPAPNCNVTLLPSARRQEFCGLLTQGRSSPRK
jgi:hypothetical protein